MLLTITTTHRPATDLGHLVRKNPARVQSFDLSFGHAHVFYPEAGEERCTVALLLEVDPIGLVRGRRGPAGAANDCATGVRRVQPPQAPLSLVGDDGRVRVPRQVRLHLRSPALHNL